MQVQRLTRRKKDYLLSGKTSQQVLVTKENNNVVISEESSAMSFGDQVLHAEILRALDVVESNYSFVKIRFTKSVLNFLIFITFWS